MTSFLLVPGAGRAWYWHRLAAELDARGAPAVAVDLPADDDDAGLAAYADTVVRAAGDADPVVVVAQSMGGLTAPLVCGRRPPPAPGAPPTTSATSSTTSRRRS